MGEMNIYHWLLMAFFGFGLLINTFDNDNSRISKMSVVVCLALMILVYMSSR